MTPLFFLLISSIWIPAGDGYQQVPIFYGEIKTCGGYSSSQSVIKGCYDDYPANIELDPRYIHDPVYLGYTVWTHEVLHAWGYGHAEMEHFFVNEAMR
jgi:hypothetical protein